MQRKLFGLLAAAVLAVGMAAPAVAGTFDAAGSSAGVGIGALPPIQVPASGPGTVSVSGGVVTETPSVFTASGTVGTALFTGVPSITNISFTIQKPAATATFADGFSVANSVGTGTLSGVGGVAALGGNTFVKVGGFLTLPIPASAIGGPAGGTVTGMLGLYTIQVEGNPWATGAASVTGVTTTTPNGAVVNTVTRTGGLTRNGSPITVGQISGGASTNLTLVSPFRIDTGGLIGVLPGFATQTLHFVPEPGTLLLLGSGVAGLAVLGRRRMRG